MRFLLPVMCLCLAGCISLSQLSNPFAEKEAKKVEECKTKPIGMLHWYMNKPVVKHSTCECSCGQKP